MKTNLTDADLLRWAQLVGTSVDELKQRMPAKQLSELRSVSSFPEHDRRCFQHPECRIAIKRADEGAYPNLEGYGAVYFDPQNPEGTEYALDFDIKERLMAGCFDRAIREDTQCACLLNHNPDQIIGRVSAGTLKLSTDRIGLRYFCDPPENQTGKFVTQAVERGDIHTSSFAFDIVEQVFRWIEGEEFDTLIREIVQVRLWDVSPVTYAAYSATTVGLSRDSQAALIKQRLERSAAKPTTAPVQRSRVAMARRKLQIAQSSQ